MPLQIFPTEQVLTRLLFEKNTDRNAEGGLDGKKTGSKMETAAIVQIPDVGPVLEFCPWHEKTDIGGMFQLKVTKVDLIEIENVSYGYSMKDS